MNFPQAIASCFSSYAKFSGRAARPEYWYWVLFLALGRIVTRILDAAIFHSPFNEYFAVHPLNTVFSTRDAVEQHVVSADLVIGGVLIPGASAPKLVSRELIGRMKTGSVVVDVAIDQGGCFETSRPTTHADPVYVVDGVTHYCVANMPGGVPRTSTFALNNATLPFVLALANKGWQKALTDDPHLKNGLNIAFGQVTCKPVADALGYKYVAPETLL